ncbi:hypothetical protein GCM10010466_06810 [Planomonospora alba]|uniref:NACHT N-terminal Helical domain-containing protein n=1 Tax=Planomonospora alba TaxID=161354 RepID=A0ABP6MLE0_9ACTN
MPALGAVATAAGKAVAERAVREWLTARGSGAERNADLKDLIRTGFPDRFVRRSFERQLAEIADGVERRLAVLVEQEYAGLTENDRAAALQEAVAVLRAADLSDRVLLAADLDPVRLAEDVRAGLPDPARQLGGAGARLYGVLLDECLDCLARIIPPRNMAEAKTLALAGEEVLLLRLPGDLGGLSEARAAATVRACWLVNGQEALAKLTALRHIRKVKHLSVLSDLPDGLRFLRSMAPLSALYVYSFDRGDPEDPAFQPELEELVIHAYPECSLDPAPLGRLPRLRSLVMDGLERGGGLAFLDVLPRLTELTLFGLDGVRDFTPVARHTDLRVLRLYGAEQLRDPAFLARFPALETLGFGASGGTIDQRAVTEGWPRLSGVELHGFRDVDDLGPLNALTLTWLRLSGMPKAADISPLARQRGLPWVHLEQTAVTDLGPLRGLPSLETLALSGSPVADLAPLAGLKALRTSICRRRPPSSTSPSSPAAGTSTSTSTPGRSSATPTCRTAPCASVVPDPAGPGRDRAGRAPPDRRRVERLPEPGNEDERKCQEQVMVRAAAAGHDLGHDSGSDDRRTDQVLRQAPGVGGSRPGDPPRRGVRLPRPERRGQDDHHPAPARRDPAHPRPGERAGHGPARSRGPRAGRIPPR